MVGRHLSAYAIRRYLAYTPVPLPLMRRCEESVLKTRRIGFSREDGTGVAYVQKHWLSVRILYAFRALMEYIYVLKL